MNWPAIFGLSAIACMASCANDAEAPALGDQIHRLAHRTRLAFTPSDPALTEGDWLRFDAGRVLLRPLVVPDRARRCDITLAMTLRSAGDPWDKSGSVFALADGAGRHFMERLADGLEADTTTFAGVMADETGTPPLELLRFITPFGAGHFSDHPKAESWRPVSVDQWADSVHWQRDVSAFQPWFQAADTVWIGVYVDTWTSEGYEVDLELRFEESDLACDLAPTHQILPLWNTTRLAHDQRDYTGFPHGPLRTVVSGIAGQVTCHLITTGHGGHEGGDEFTPQRHRLLVDGELLNAWTPWRTDCGAFRRFNPSSGVWEVEHAGRTERLASSDLSRSNWCPGSDVPPKAFDLGRWDGVAKELALDIPEAQDYGVDAFNFWNVSAYLQVNP